MQTGEDAVEKLSCRRQIILVSNVLRRKASQFVLGIAGHPLVSLVGGQVSVLEVGHCNTDCGRLKHGWPALLARA